MNIDIKMLLQYLADKHTYRVDYLSPNVDTSFSIMPRQYLSYAQKDLESGYEHQYINALSNMNRALICQINRLLKLLGYYNQSREEQWSFVKKVQLIREFGISLPRDVKKSNSHRNTMEHWHNIPDPAMVLNSLNIISKFIEHTDFFASAIKHTTVYCNDSKPYFAAGSMVRIDISKSNASINILVGEEVFKIHKDSKAYIEVFRRHLHNCKKPMPAMTKTVEQEKNGSLTP
ncbi:hypothetical protein FC093_16970 [Ilyomonas limi]|uniref:Uncharacterized protein n=1 Tax=Ilyomonas limi TaxID=2575867 RepID=A0A4U3KZU6_9BACT|nr:hypothetical protein [Ilyomonas limi]TKK66726.1 hypothetical protein FC093_16970 [Ilyomonas limi]